MYEVHWTCPSTAAGCINAWGREGHQGSFTKDQCDAEIEMQSGGFRRNGYPVTTECIPVGGGSGGAPMTLAFAPLGGGFAGALVASLITYKSNGEHPYQQGIEQGAGGLLALVAIGGAGSRSPVVTSVAGGVSGALLGHGWGVQKVAEGKEDTKIKDAVTFGAIGTGIGFSMSKLSKSVGPIPGIRVLRHVDLFMSSRGFWLGGRW